MIKLNKNIKYISYLFAGSTFSFYVCNVYKHKYSHFEIDLSKLDWKSENSIEDKEINKRNKMICYRDDPFEIIKNFDIDEYLLKQVTTVLYTSPLTNKLYPKSNLYGHELIRYFDK